MKRIVRPLLVLSIVVLVWGCASSTTVKPTSEEEIRARRLQAEQSYSIGASYYAQRNYDAAMENFQRALEIDSTYYDPCIAIGNIWRFRRDPIQAKEFYRRAMRLDPRKAKAYEGLGDLFLEMSGMDSTYVDSALAAYRKGLEMDSSLVDLYNGVAQIYVKTERMAQADSVYKEALRRFPDDLSVMRLWGEFLYKMRRYAEAVEALKPLVARFKSDPSVTSLRVKLATALAEIGRYSEAVLELDEVLKIDPSDKQALLAQGVILARQGKFSQALAKFDQVIAMDSSMTTAYVAKADVLVKQGRLSPAEAELRRALRIDPDMASAYASLGDINRQQGDASRGKNITATPVAKLREAKSYYEAARQYYQKAAADPAYASFSRTQIAYVNRNIELIDKELFVRG
ncbi:MAG: tetratricopeptide repeat protein [candidate division WOR-3 bacterium]